MNIDMIGMIKEIEMNIPGNVIIDQRTMIRKENQRIHELMMNYLKHIVIIVLKNITIVKHKVVIINQNYIEKVKN